MALVTASFLVPSIESVTRRQIMDRFLLESGLGQVGTATGGSTTTIVNTTRLQSNQYPDNMFANQWARISYDAGGAAAAPEAEIRPISTSTASSGTVTFAPAMSAAVASGDRYQLVGFPHPQDILDHLDNVMTEDCYLPEWTMLTEVPDGDMEASNTTEWAATNATVAKATAEPGMWGKRYLTVLTTSANGYAQSDDLRVIPGRSYYVSAIARADSASCTPTLIAYDSSNSAAIATRTTTSRTSVRLWAQFSAPSGCHVINIRLSNAENDVTSAWDEVVFYSPEANDIALPWWVRNSSQVKGIFRARWNPAGTDAWDPMPRGVRDHNKWDIRDSSFGRNQLRIVSRHGPLTDSIYILGTRNEVAFSNDNNDAKRLDANWAQAALGKRVFNELRRLPANTTFETKWLTETRNEYFADYERARRAQETRLETMLQAETPDQFYFSRGVDGLRPGPTSQ